MKKIICLILTLALCINSIAIISADSIYNPLTEKIEEVLAANISAFGDDFKISEVDLSELSYGAVINAYTVIDRELTESQVEYIPIYYDNEVYGVMEKFPNGNGGYNYSYSEGYAEELNDFLDHNHSVVIVGAESGMIAYNEDDVAVLSGTFENSYINILESESEQLSYTTVSHSIPLDVESSMQQMRVNSVTSYSNSLNVPYRQQYNNYSCWAACIASIGMYLGGPTYSALQICDMVNNHAGADMSFIKQTLNTVYGISSSISLGEPTKTAIKNLINSNKPILSAFKTSATSSTAHDVVARGYVQNTNTFTFMYMDPWYGNYQTVTVSNSDSLHIVLNTISYNVFSGYILLSEAI